jgi:hypothetical protein
MVWDQLKAAAIAGCAFVAGCADMRGVTMARWPAEFRPPLAPAEGAVAMATSPAARAIDYYSQRWSMTALGPAYGYKLLDPAARGPWEKTADAGDRLHWMRFENSALAARLGLSATVRTAPTEAGLMPLTELRQTEEFQADPEAYLPWYRVGRYRVGPYDAGISGVGAYLRAQERPDLALKHQQGAVRVVMGMTGAVLAAPLIAGGVSMLRAADRAAEAAKARGELDHWYPIFPDEEETRDRNIGVQLIIFGIAGALAPVFMPSGYQRMDKACAEFNAMLDGRAP